jgi:hypothetical protein
MAKGAKRKAAKRKKTVGRKAATTRRTRSAGKRSASAGKKSASAAKKSAAARKRAGAPKKKTARKATASARKATKKVVKTRKAAPPPRTARATKVVKRAAPVIGKVAKRAAPVAKKKKEVVPVRTAPSLNRERRTIADEDIVQTPPSSLDFDRSASAARSGRRELLERYEEHTETGPDIAGGDVDADWESAYSVGDEAPGGDNPTPDQDLVDDIGRAVGIEYQDNEELKGEAKVSKRDKNRWELDPASSDDWDER